MDLWVVAAATGAGYLAKYLQNSAEEKEELLETSSKKRDQNWAFCGIARRKGSRFGDIFQKSDDDITNGSYENSYETRESTDLFDGGDALRELETNQLTRNKLLSSRRAHGFSIKKKIVKKGYIFSPPPSPSTPFAAPLIVNPVIDRDTSYSFVHANDKDDRFSLEEKNELLGSFLSRQSGLVELPRTRKHKVGKGQLGIAGSGGTLLSQGPLNGVVLFFAGITIGIISSLIANKRKLDNITTELKQKENLVRDLHEVIEMRDRLTVKEIYNEDIQSLKSTNRSSDWELVVSSSKHDLEESTKLGCEELDDQNADNPELMSRIEAELEVELEKLEVNLTSSGLEGISDYVECDRNLEADAVQGENNASETSTNHTDSSNYEVSLYELSLRLHELIESRLVARIEELELAIKNSKKRHGVASSNA